jgi:hypothetical protein
VVLAPAGPEPVGFVDDPGFELGFRPGRDPGPVAIAVGVIEDDPDDRTRVSASGRPRDVAEEGRDLEPPDDAARVAEVGRAGEVRSERLETGRAPLDPLPRQLGLEPGPDVRVVGQGIDVEAVGDRP